MSVIKSKYRAPLLYRNRHIATIVPSMYRAIHVDYERDRLELEDGDFIDLDWLGKGRKKIIILSHGLEGNSQRHYITSIADHFYKKGWGVAAWNCRSCSGEMNRLPRLYSHIDAPDLAEVVDYIAATQRDQIAIAGISMGGAITLNYMSKLQVRHPNELIGAVAISPPTDVSSGSKWLDKPGNKFYRNRFLKKMLRRVVLKVEQFPELADLSGLDGISSFEEYDRKYTATMTGCANLDEFYNKANSIGALHKIDKPTLMLTSADDPFMPESCYPYSVAKGHQYFHLEVTKHGGHTGFIMNKLRHSWMEHRTFEFLNEIG
jgi:predicted alpha/beta-fold hydrolase